MGRSSEWSLYTNNISKLNQSAAMQKVVLTLVIGILARFQLHRIYLPTL